MAPKIFIDGEAGTTGLQILQRLAGRKDIELVSIDPPGARMLPRARRSSIAPTWLSCVYLTTRRARRWPLSTMTGSG